MFSFTVLHIVAYLESIVHCCTKFCIIVCTNVLCANVYLYIAHVCGDQIANLFCFIAYICLCVAIIAYYCTLLFARGLKSHHEFSLAFTRIALEWLALPP